MNDIARDLRLAGRNILRRPRTSVLVVLCAALAIGLNATIFSLVSAVALFEPAAENPDELVRLYGTYPGFEHASLSYPNYVDLRDRNEVFSDFATYGVTAANVSIDGHNERMPAVLVTGNYFRTFGVHAARGRVFTAEDDVNRMGHPVAVIGDRMWQTRFGSDPDVVGRTISINSQPFTVIGVAPPAWRGTFPGMVLDLYIPMQMQPLLQPAQSDVLESRGSGWLMSAARLKPGISLAKAQAGLDITVAALVEQHPELNEDWGVAVHQGVVPFPPSVGRVLEMGSAAMLLLVGCVLLIACANIAGLLLARAEQRQREIGIRLAIGAGRGRLVRQLLVESTLLALLGGGFGMLIAVAAARVFPGLFPSLGGLPVTVDISPDAGVFGFTLALTLLTGLVFGLVPALQSTRLSLVPVLRGEAGAGTGKKRLTMRRLLVGFQVAMSMMLLLTAGFFVTSLDKERHVELGFESKGLLLVGIDPSLHGYDEATGLQLLDQLRQRVAALPGVVSAAYGETVPLALVGNQQRGIQVEGYTPAEGERMNPEYNMVSEGYFATLGLPVEEGRAFTVADNGEAAPAVVINRALADRYWPRGGALGSRLYTAGAWRTVIGITADGKYNNRREQPQPHFYLPIRQVWEPTQQLHVASTVEALSLVTPVRRALAELDPKVAIYDVRSMDQHLEQSLLLQKLGTHLVGLFGGLALVLASIGLFGLLMHAVASRTREIGIRMSIGARAGDVFRQVLGEGFALVTAGMALGALGAGLLGRLLSGLLYGVSGTEPGIYAGVGSILLVTALAAIALPALRATRVDPMTALRHD